MNPSEYQPYYHNVEIQAPPPQTVIQQGVGPFQVCITVLFFALVAFGGGFFVGDSIATTRIEREQESKALIRNLLKGPIAAPPGPLP